MSKGQLPLTNYSDLSQAINTIINLSGAIWRLLDKNIKQ